jgi:hypothetical protein
MTNYAHLTSSQSSSKLTSNSFFVGCFLGARNGGRAAPPSRSPTTPWPAPSATAWPVQARCPRPPGTPRPPGGPRPAGGTRPPRPPRPRPAPPPVHPSKSSTCALSPAPERWGWGVGAGLDQRGSRPSSSSISVPGGALLRRCPAVMSRRQSLAAAVGGAGGLSVDVDGGRRVTVGWGIE